MKLVMTLLVADEQDLLEANLDYHLTQGVDFVVVTADRGGPESIAATVRRYVERGVCHLIEADPSGYLQGDWITRMARMAAVDFGADWVINADIDEFYWPQTGTLKGIFSAIPDEFGKLTLPVVHFVPRPGDGFFADRMTLRETLSRKAGTVKAPSAAGRLTKVAHRGVEDVEVSRGGHRATGTGLAPLLGWEPIIGFHFPLRSYAQFESKVRRDGRTADPKIQAIRSDLYEHHTGGRLPDVYERRVVDDAEARSGVEEGRFVVDERLKRFFETAGREAPGEPTVEEIEALRAEMEHALEERDRHPLTADIRHLEERLEISEERLAKFRDALERLERKRTMIDARNAHLRDDLDAMRLNHDVTRRKLKAKRKKSKLLRAELEKARRPFARIRDVIARAATAMRAATRR